jgi:hypothetical protein
MILSRAISRQAYIRPPQTGLIFNTALAEFSSDVTLFGKPSIKIEKTDAFVLRFRRGASNLFAGQGTIEFCYYRTANPVGFRTLYRIVEVSTAIAIITRSNGTIYARARFGATTFETGFYPSLLNEWNHVAVTLENNQSLTLWLNGERKETIGDIGENLVTSGGTTYGLAGGDINGLSYRREFRVSRSIRYDKANATYDVPTGPFVNDPDTYMLFHLDGDDENAAGIPQLIDDLSVPEPTPPPIYIEATGGTLEEYEEGGEFYRSHTFTATDTFEVTQLGNTTDLNQLEYMIVAGGGGSADFSGGGGAGGHILGSIQATLASYPFTIGAGGVNANIVIQGAPGHNSTALGFTAIGGGGGGGMGGANPGGTGGSGGGGSPRDGAGGAGVVGQGNPGGSGGREPGGSTITDYGSGGGGGAGVAGGDGTFRQGGNGGDGLSNTLRDGTLQFYAGGGAGMGDARNGASQQGIPGLGGGGIAATGVPGDQSNTPGEPNTGGGAGAGGPGGVARAGGSGIVIVRYQIAELT